MPSYPFITVDVFTDRQFGGNPLAVFTDARGLTDRQMQQLATEFNYSESTFVLPPADPAHTARVRIFNPTAEMPFAGHPNVGTAFVLAQIRSGLPDTLRFEEGAGLVSLTLERNPDGTARGASITAPQPLSTGGELSSEDTASCLGLAASAILTKVHRPVVASVGMPFLIAEVAPDALSEASPNLDAFKQVTTRFRSHGDGLEIFFYCRDDARRVRARMFGPLAGTIEDPATGSASAALVALLLQRSGGDELVVDISQGVEMGRPSRIGARAWRTPEGIRSSVRGEAVMVFRGEAIL
jgi:trans-2,3-dihydro-3-hydroxyanthranilate isomerase